MSYHTHNSGSFKQIRVITKFSGNTLTGLFKREYQIKWRMQLLTGQGSDSQSFQFHRPHWCILKCKQHLKKWSMVETAFQIHLLEQQIKGKLTVLIRFE